MPNRWDVITPFKVIDHNRFREAAQDAILWDNVFKRNQSSYFFSVDRACFETAKRT